MYKLFKYVVDFFLYTHVFIGICAVCISLSTQLFIHDFIRLGINEAFIFCSTVALYSLHRIIGINKILRHIGSGRFQKIRPLKSVLWLNVFLGGGLSLYIYFLQFDLSLKYFLIIPSVLSLAYVIPIWRGRRMRDIAYIKVFIIALVWSLVTTVIPLWGTEHQFWYIDELIILERFLFILAITLPFDIRDSEIDGKQGVKTLANTLGNQFVKRLSLIALSAALIINIFLYLILNLSTPALTGYIMTYIFAGFLINLAEKNNSDYYFSGWLDATMIILFILTYGLNTIAYYLFNH